MPKQKKKEKEQKPGEFDIGLGGMFGDIFKGLENLVDLAEKLEAAGGEIKKQGDFTVNTDKDVRGVYGFSIRTATGKDGRQKPIVEPFGNIKKTEKGTVVEDTREPLVDVFEENNTMLIVAELPGVAEEEISCEIKGDVVILSTMGEKKYSKEILLPGIVDEKPTEKSYNNGILELRLKKQSH